MTLDYVDVATARAAAGTRIVTSSLVASPWSEAAKGMFALAKLPALVVARGRDATDVMAWTGIDNVPVVLHEHEPPRTSWASIVALANRLAGPDVLVPVDPVARAEVFGLLELVAGEDGLGWNGRLAMLQVSFESSGTRGFPIAVANFLAGRYGRDATTASLRERVTAQLGVLAQRLTGSYFAGDRPGALDVYVATFLTPYSAIDETACPQMIAPLRRAFGAAYDTLGDLVPAELWAHRQRMFDRHLPWPIRLS
jgi:glutathione S-transferase